MSAADDRLSPREVIDSRQRAYRGDARDMLRAYDAEVDRLRAELAETRAAGDELALAVAPIERMGRGAPGSRLDVLITRAEAWRSVRGGAPAEPPAEPWCTGTGPSGLRAAQECAATHDHSAAPADDAATVVVPRVHLRSWVEFLRALVQQDAIRTLNARDAVLDNARQIECWAGQGGGTL
ncbi:hypothetical protein [Pseudonocardia alni]|uniref:hypothetical protein n=1 Tax=Pseudonocardia alni TaxID=33907 RepID=UPI0027AA46F0|nr:hypothetical protein PaSha_14125 [Pseudonocardia alni]WFG47472.1 hypothetical protein PaSha_28740 [Pseudonocardia alni]